MELKIFTKDVPNLETFFYLTIEAEKDYSLWKKTRSALYYQNFDVIMRKLHEFIEKNKEEAKKQTLLNLFSNQSANNDCSKKMQSVKEYWEEVNNG